jgi:hypothetical protein
VGFVIGLLTALTSGVAGAVAAFFASAAGARAQGVSNFDGERGYLVVFVFVPLGFGLGLLVGGLTAFVGRGRGLGGFARQAGLAVLITCALIGALGGLAVLAVDHPPSLEGRPLFLDFEVRVPPEAGVPDDLKGAEFQASLFATDSDNRYADVDLDKVESREGRRVIPGSASLNSESDRRTLLVGVSGETSQVFDVRLPAAPRKEDTGWSAWARPRERLDGKPVAAAAAYEVRYRVRIADP